MNCIGVVTCDCVFAVFRNLLQCFSIHLHVKWHIKCQNKNIIEKKAEEKKILLAISFRLAVNCLCAGHWLKMSKLQEILGLDKVNRLFAILKHNGGLINSLHKLYKWVSDFQYVQNPLVYFGYIMKCQLW